MQEVGWFDRDENNSAAITGRLAVDAMAVRGAVGDQLGMFTQNIVTLLGGYVIALINGWRMALVVIATLPLIAVAAGFAVKVEGDFSSKADELFSGANKLAMEAFTSIRTVAAFTMEKQVCRGGVGAGSHQKHADCATLPGAACRSQQGERAPCPDQRHQPGRQQLCHLWRVCPRVLVWQRRDRKRDHDL